METSGYNTNLSPYIADWILRETTPIDLVASWETLCDTYRQLEFADPLADTTRMEEFKWIVAEMNKHLTRMRKKLLSCRNIQAVREALETSYLPAGSMTITGRRDLAYQKLRQTWVVKMASQATDLMAMENEEEPNGERE